MSSFSFQKFSYGDIPTLQIIKALWFPLNSAAMNHSSVFGNTTNWKFLSIGSWLLHFARNIVDIFYVSLKCPEVIVTNKEVIVDSVELGQKSQSIPISDVRELVEVTIRRSKDSDTNILVIEGNDNTLEIHEDRCGIRTYLSIRRAVQFHTQLPVLTLSNFERQKQLFLEELASR